MRPLTLLRLAFSGSGTDRVRAGLTLVTAALAALGFLATATVLNMAPTETVIGNVTYRNNWRYTTTLLNDTGVRVGLILMTAGTILPALMLVVQAARLGGPARDQRLAAMRLAGASPRQCRAIAAAEQGVTVGFGALLGIGAYLVLHQVLHRPTMREGLEVESFVTEGGVTLPAYTGPLLPLPTDTWPQWWVWPAVVLGLPFIAALLSVFALRRIIAAPMATATRARRAKPRLWPSLLILTGLSAMVACRVWIDRLEAREQPVTLPYALLVVALLAVCVGVPLSAAGIGYLMAKPVLRLGNGRPAALVAARRVLADPYSGSRAVAGLLVSTTLLAVLVGWQTYFDHINEVANGYGGSRGDEQLNTLVVRLLAGLAAMFVAFACAGLLVALVDSALTRRRTDAALLAGGTPNGVLIRARVTVVLLTAVPGVLLGVVTGFAAPMLALPPAQQPASVTLTCHGFGDGQPEVPCTPEGVAQQKRAERNFANGLAYSYIVHEQHGPWRNVYPSVPWGTLGFYGGCALAATALATVLSLLAGRRGGAETALRTT